MFRDLSKKRKATAAADPTLASDQPPPSTMSQPKMKGTLTPLGKNSDVSPLPSTKDELMHTSTAKIPNSAASSTIKDLPASSLSTKPLVSSVSSQPNPDITDKLTVDLTAKPDLVSLVQELMTKDAGRELLNSITLKGMPTPVVISELSKTSANVDGSTLTSSIRTKDAILTTSTATIPLSVSTKTTGSLPAGQELIDTAATRDAAFAKIPPLPSQYGEDEGSYASYSMRENFTFESVSELFRVKIAGPNFEPIFVPTPLGPVASQLPIGAPPSLFEKTWETIGPGSITAYWTLSPSFVTHLSGYGVAWEKQSFVLQQQYLEALHTTGTSARDMSTKTQATILAGILAAKAMVDYASVLVTTDTVTISNIASDLSVYGPGLADLVGKDLITPVGFIPSFILPITTNNYASSLAHEMLDDLPIPNLGLVDTFYAIGTNVLQERRFFHTCDTLTSTILSLERSRLLPSRDAGEELYELLQKCANVPASITYGDQMSRAVNVHEDMDMAKISNELLHGIICFPKLKVLIAESWRDMWISMGLMTPWLSSSDLQLALDQAKPLSQEQLFATGFKDLCTANAPDYIQAKILEYGPDLYSYQFPPVVLTKRYSEDRGRLTAMFLTWLLFPRLACFGKHHLGNFIWNFLTWYDRSNASGVKKDLDRAATDSQTTKSEGKFKERDTMSGYQSCFFTYTRFGNNVRNFQNCFNPITISVPQNARDEDFPRMYTTDHIFGGSSAEITDNVNPYINAFAAFNLWLNAFDPTVKVNQRRRQGAAVVAANAYHSAIEAALTPIFTRQIFLSHINFLMCHSWPNLGNGYTGTLDALPPHTLGLYSTEGLFKSCRSLLQVDGRPMELSWGLANAGANVLCYHLGALNSLRDNMPIQSVALAFPSPEVGAHSYLNFISKWNEESMGLGTAQYVYRLLKGEIDLGHAVNEPIQAVLKAWAYASKSTGIKKIIKLIRGVAGGSDSTLGSVAIDDRIFETPDLLMSGKLVVVTRIGGARVLTQGTQITSPSPLGLGQDVTYLSEVEQTKMSCALTYVFHPDAPLSHIMKGVFIRKVVLAANSSKVIVRPGGKVTLKDGVRTYERPLIRPTKENFITVIHNQAMVMAFYYKGETYLTPHSFPQMDFELSFTDLNNKTMMAVLQAGMLEDRFGLYIPDAMLHVNVSHGTSRDTHSEKDICLALLNEIGPNSIPTYYSPRIMRFEGDIYAYPPQIGSTDYYIHLLGASCFNEGIMDSPFLSGVSTDTTYIPPPVIQEAGELLPSGLAAINGVLKVDMPGAMSNVNPVSVLTAKNITSLADVKFEVGTVVSGNPLDPEFSLLDLSD